MSPAMVDTAAAAPPLKQLTSRRPRSAALSNINANAGAPKAKAKTVASRYLSGFAKPSSTSSKPAVVTSSSTASAAATTAAARRTASPAPRRAASAAERVQPHNVAATPGATRRTLSVAFQSPTYCLDTSSRARSVSPAPAAAFSPEKKRSSTLAASVRTKVSEGGQNTYRWPSSATAAAPSGHDAGALAPSLEHSASNYKRIAPATYAAALSRASYDETPRRASVDGASATEYLRALCSDTDSASSAGSRDGLGTASGQRVMSSSARFMRDAPGTRSDRFAYPASAVASPSPPVKKRSLFNGLLSTSPFRKPSLKQQQSPSKPVCSSFGTAESPSRPRRSMEMPALAGRAPASTNCIGDMKVKAPGPNKAEEEHQLKLIYSRHLQWRHANAQAAAVRSSRRAAAEKTLISAWIAILRMRRSVATTKLRLQLLRNNCKLMAILRGQIEYLEEWSSLERVDAVSLSGTALALRATVLRLPVSDGAMADIQALKNAVGSAIDVMQRIGNSKSIQLSKLARANVLVTQLSRVAIQELILMARCRELLSTLASMHVKHCSLQGQSIQMNQRRLGRFQ